MLSTIITTLVAANGFTPVVAFEDRLTPSGAPALQLGVLSEPLVGELSAAAKAWALGRREALGLHPASTLTFEAGFQTRFGASLHYQQRVDGLEVYQAKLVITVDRSARVVQIASSLVGPRAIRSAPLMSEAQAFERAATLIEYPMLRPDAPSRVAGAARKVFFEIDDELRLGWFLAAGSMDQTKNYYLGFDATTGAPLFVQNRVYRAENDVNVYPVSPGGLDAGVGRTPTVTASLTRPDGGSFVSRTCQTLLPDAGMVETDNDGGLLCGDQLTSLNCCLRVGCAPDAGTNRITGPTTFSMFGFTLTLDVDIPTCDYTNRATNQRLEGDFRYQPVDPPMNRGAVDIDDPANSDTFAQVHSFYHVNRVYDWMRGLSTTAAPLFPTNQPMIVPFRMRDERKTPARHPAVIANVVIPNFQDVQGIPACLPPQFGGTGMGRCRVGSFGRFDNAEFRPVENFPFLILPGLNPGVDAVIMYQGNAADPSYDATVLWHEFGHGIIQSTAALTFAGTTLDARGANREGAALHEGLSDYISGAFGQVAELGPYFGPRATAQQMMGVTQDAYLRTLNNTERCPNTLWGQQHQDGQHVAGALWEGRLANLGTDNGATYDAAFYAMLVSLAPNAGFTRVAEVMAARVSTAFTPAAGAALTQIFRSRGVIDCSKVLDVTATTPPRRLFVIPGEMNTTFPGPIQFKLRAPDGAQGIRVRAQGGGGAMGGTPNVLVKTGGPITFTPMGTTSVTDDAEFRGRLQGNDSTTSVRVPCGASQEVYVAITGRPTQLENLTVSVEPLVNCMFPVDAGMPVDAGAPVDAGVDAGTPPTETKSLAFVGTLAQPSAATGCGCSAFDGSLVLAALALLGLRRRAR